MRARSQATWRFKDGFRDRPENLGKQRFHAWKQSVCSHMKIEQTPKRSCSERQCLCQCFGGSKVEWKGFGRVSKFNAKGPAVELKPQGT
jgi:hypothetical protein